MAMIPRVAIPLALKVNKSILLIRYNTVMKIHDILECLELVGVSVQRSNGTLCHTINAVSFVGMKLANAMPIDISKSAMLVIY